MNRFYFLLTTLFFMVFSPLPSQEWTIEECLAKGEKNYPLVLQYRLVEQTKEISLAAANKGYIPQITLSAKASYQSDVPSMPSELGSLLPPGMMLPTVNKDQYQATIDIYQPFYDGGTLRADKKEAQANAAVETQTAKVNIYTVRERICQLFFGLILCQEQISLNRIYNENLERNRKEIQSFIDNGLASSTDMDAVMVEVLKNNQRLSELLFQKKAFQGMLSLFIAEDIPENGVMVRPQDCKESLDGTIRRPELDLFKAQKEQISASQYRLESAYIPRIGLALQGGLGNPGLNMLKNGFATYYYAAVRFSWTINGLYTRSDNLHKIQLRQQMIDTQKETFLFNTQMQVRQQNSDLEKIDQLMKDDDTIIRLRENIRVASQLKVANGVESVSDLMAKMIIEQQARQEKILHQVQKWMTIYTLKNTTNNY